LRAVSGRADTPVRPPHHRPAGRTARPQPTSGQCSRPAPACPGPEPP